MKAFLFIIFSFIITLNSVAQNRVNYKIVDKNTRFPNLNNLKFLSNAQCAIDSKKPARSFFLIVDSNTLARTIYKLSKRENLNSLDEITKAISSYRKVILNLTQEIINKMISEKLPLLKLGRNIGFSEFDKEALRCKGKVSVSCRGLTELFSKLYSISEIKNGVDYHEKIEELGINFNDSVSIKDSFNHRKYEKSWKYLKKEANRGFYSCYRLKRFSPISAKINSYEPTLDGINHLGKILNNLDEFMVSCDKSEQVQDLKHVIYQFDLKNSLSQETAERWRENGFNFYYSLKTYLSFFIRNDSFLKKVAPRYKNIFKRLLVEESIYLMSNGCSSLEKPECSDLSLSKERMRKISQNITEYDQNEYFLSHGLKKPIDYVVENKGMDKYFEDYEFASDWSSYFFKRTSKIRGNTKLRLVNSYNEIKAIVKKLTINEEITFHNLKSLLSSKKFYSKNEAYHLCSELSLSSFTNVDEFSMNGLRYLYEKTGMSSLGNIDVLKNGLTFLNRMRDKVLPLCKQLSHEKKWTNFTPKDRHFRWYDQLVKGNKSNRRKFLIDEERLKFYEPTLAWNGYKKNKKSNLVICQDVSHCIRTLLSHYTDLRKIYRYSLSLLEGINNISTLKLNNSLEGRFTCGIYDPWEKTNNLLKQFLLNLGSAAVSSFSPAPLFISGKVQGKKIQSFKEINNAGLLSYEPRYSKKKVNLSLLGDLSTYNIPCSISHAGGDLDPLKYYLFDGINISYCNSQNSKGSEISGEKIVSKRANKKTKTCFTCSLNLKTIPTILGPEIFKYSVPIFSFGFAIVDFFRDISDPINIPKSWQVNLNNLYFSYKRNGEIDKKCFKRLMEGGACFSYCEANIIKNLKLRFKNPEVEWLEIGKKSYKVKIRQCKNILESDSQFDRKDCEDKADYYKSVLIESGYCKK